MASDSSLQFLEIPSGDCRLMGCLHRPTTPGPYPIVVCCHGLTGTRIGTCFRFVSIAWRLAAEGLHAGRQNALEVRVHNYGTTAAAQVPVTLALDGQDTDRAYATVAPGESRWVTLACPLMDAAAREMTIALPADDYPPDDRLSVVLTPRAKLNVLAVVDEKREDAHGSVNGSHTAPWSRGGRLAGLSSVDAAPGRRQGRPADSADGRTTPGASSCPRSRDRPTPAPRDAGLQGGGAVARPRDLRLRVAQPQVEPPSRGLFGLHACFSVPSILSRYSSGHLPLIYSAAFSRTEQWEKDRVPREILDRLARQTEALRDEGLFKHDGDLLVWLTDDDRRIPVLMRAQIPVGAIEAKITAYSPPRTREIPLADSDPEGRP